MKRLFFLFSLLIACVLTAVCAEKPVEYFSVGNPIKYCGDKYYFAWSSNPVDHYFVQEYLPEGETFDNYKRMFTVSVLMVNLNPVDAIKAKMAELDERKKNDPVTNYLVAENDGDYILEFLVSDSNGDEMNCAELDIHYYSQKQIFGRKVSVLYFYSERAYGDDITPFIKSIPEKRAKLYEGMTKLDLMPKFERK